jgi:hypothetical protein
MLPQILLLRVDDARLIPMTINIQSWRADTQINYSAGIDTALLEKVKAVAELPAAASARLVRRIMARCAVSFPIRFGASCDELVNWLNAAGAVVVVGPAPEKSRAGSGGLAPLTWQSLNI